MKERERGGDRGDMYTVESVMAVMDGVNVDPPCRYLTLRDELSSLMRADPEGGPPPLSARLPSPRPALSIATAFTVKGHIYIVVCKCLVGSWWCGE